MTYVPRRPALLATIGEAAAFARQSRSLPGLAGRIAADLQPGEGPVLLLPPVFTADPVTADLGGFLGLLGYTPHGWGLGVNLGPTRLLMEGARSRLQHIAAAEGPVALVGISMGGLFARWLALSEPALVRQVITCASPFRESYRSAFIPLGAMVRRWPGPDLAELATQIAAPLPVPGTFIYTRRDGIVAWESCLEPAQPDDNAEVSCPHVAMPHDPVVWRHIARRLADPHCAV